MAIALYRGFPDDDSSGNSAGQQRTIDGQLPNARASRPLSPARSAIESDAEVPRQQGGPLLALPGNTAVAGENVNTERSDGLDFDSALVKEAFAHVAAYAPHAMEYFYAHLFIQHPEIRGMFPLTMSEHRERVFGALAQLVWSMDSPPALSAYLELLGREHRKFGVKEKHYAAFFEALLATVEHFNGPRWTTQAQAACTAAFGYTATVMLRAAALDAQAQPPWWVGEVAAHELRSPNLAVLRIRPDQPLRYRAGQYLSVQVARWPREWRNYSIANAPRPDGLLELHVRAVPGGMVSNSLVHHCQAGDMVLLGPARGDLAAPADPQRDLVCIAGGSGLAPIKAIIEEIIETAGHGRRPGISQPSTGHPSTNRSSISQPTISLFVGAQRAEELYDLTALRAMEAAYPRLTVIPVVSAEPEFPGIRGMLPTVVRQRASCAGREIYVCGPDAMVLGTKRLLARRSPAQLIHHDPISTPANDS